MVYAFLALVVGGLNWTSQKPELLLRFEAERRGIDRARIRWSTLDHLRHEESRRYYENDIAGNDFVSVYLGNDQGVTRYRVLDGNREPVFGEPDRLLARDGDVWSYTEDDLIARVSTADWHPGMFDIRALGASLDASFNQPWEEYAERERRTDELREFAVRADSDGTEVYMRYRSEPDLVTRWTFDPKLGPNPVKSELIYEGEVVRTCRVTYGEPSGGVRFPKRVEYFDERDELVFELDVDDCDINDSNLPAELTPSDIGVGNGINIHYLPGHPRYGTVEIFCEGEVLSTDRFHARQRTVGVEPAPALARRFPYLVRNYERVVARNMIYETRGEGQPVTSQPTRVADEALTDWAVYLLQFIKRYELDDEQKQKAVVILRECQGAARAHVAQNVERLRRVEVRLEETKSLPPDSDERRKVVAERDRLVEPLDRIFSKQLVPRLDRLPTARQRKSAESKPPLETPLPTKLFEKR